MGLRIAMVGTRGVPANYSGFETCVEELGARLVERGHQVTVYCRSHHVQYPGDQYRGMRLVKLPTIRNKYLDTIVHTALSCVHLAPQPFDVVMAFIVGNSPVCLIPKLAGKPVALNVDGLDWQRDKWPSPAKRYLRWCERIAGFTTDAIVTDARVVQEYYRDEYGLKTHLIAYGADVHRLEPNGTLSRFGLTPDEYVLYVGRLVPENRADELIDAFADLQTDKRCVIVGDAPYEDDYKRALQRQAEASGGKVTLAGYVFGDGYWELLTNAYAYVFPPMAGGSHPALIEALAVGNCVVVRDTPANLEVAAGVAIPYPGDDGTPALRDILQRVVDDPGLVSEYRARASRYIAERYSWERVADAYEALFYDLAARG